MCENSENKVCSTNLDLESEFRGLRELAVKSSVGGYADIVNPDISHENSTIVNKKPEHITHRENINSSLNKLFHY